MASYLVLKMRAPGAMPPHEIDRDQRILRPEAVVQRFLGRAGKLGHRVDTDGPNPLLVEQLRRRGGDALTRGCEAGWRIEQRCG